jgi:DNA polymerase V
VTYRQQLPYRRIICRGQLYETGSLFCGTHSALATHLYAQSPRATLRGALRGRLPLPCTGLRRKELDLNELCIRRRASTFFVRASGNSMQDLGLFDGDVMVVDRAEEAAHHDIVIAEVDGEFTVKRLQLQPCLALLPMNPAYPVIYPEELQLLGVVTWFFNSARARRR